MQGVSSGFFVLGSSCPALCTQNTTLKNSDVATSTNATMQASECGARSHPTAIKHRVLGTRGPRKYCATDHQAPITLAPNSTAGMPTALGLRNGLSMEEAPVVARQGSNSPA